VSLVEKRLERLEELWEPKLIFLHCQGRHGMSPRVEELK